MDYKELKQEIAQLKEIVKKIGKEGFSQSRQLDEINKKIEYIDKSVDLKFKHFDEILQSAQIEYEKSLKNIQDDIRYQAESLTNISGKLTSLKYWYITVGIIILGIIAILIPKSTQTKMPELAEIKKSNQQLVLIVQNESKNITETVNKQNEKLLNAIKTESQEVSAPAISSTATPLKTSILKKELKAIKKQNEKLITKIQEDNQKLLSALQQTNQEYMATIAELIHSIPAPAPAQQNMQTEPIEENEQMDTFAPAEDEF